MFCKKLKKTINNLNNEITYLKKSIEDLKGRFKPYEKIADLERRENELASLIADYEARLNDSEVINNNIVLLGKVKFNVLINGEEPFTLIGERIVYYSDYIVILQKQLTFHHTDFTNTCKYTGRKQKGIYDAVDITVAKLPVNAIIYTE